MLERDTRERIRYAVDAASREKQAHLSDQNAAITDLRTLQALAPDPADPRRLTDDEREVWVDRNVLGRTLSDIGQTWGDGYGPERSNLTRERIRQIEESAGRKLSALLGADIRFSDEHLPDIRILRKLDVHFGRSRDLLDSAKGNLSETDYERFVSQLGAEVLASLRELRGTQA